jgi:hypothetical protein
VHIKCPVTELPCYQYAIYGYNEQVEGPSKTDILLSRSVAEWLSSSEHEATAFALIISRSETGKIKLSALTGVVHTLRYITN